MQPEDQKADNNNNNNNFIGTLNCMSKIQTEKAPSTLLSKEGHNMHKLSKGWSHWCLAGDK